MSEYYFGVGPGYLPEKARKIAKQHGADVINHTDAPCLCGHGCNPHTCPESRRHWLAVPNLGEPFNRNKEREVLAALESNGFKV